jgi:integrase
MGTHMGEMMTRQFGKLTALAVQRAKQRGYLADGGGLYLQLSGSGAKSWVFRYRLNGRLREMGLGPARDVTLAEAREAALACRRQRLAGIDPIAARTAERQQAVLQSAKAMTFRQCAEGYVDAHKAGWKNLKHSGQWSATLRTYAYPVLGDVSIQLVDVALVMKVLDPIWAAKTETASRLRGRIERVLDWAAVRGFREGDNPARWRGHLDHVLPQPSKVKRVVHHAALPYDEIASFMAELRQQPGIAAMALEFAILTAARTGEVIGGTWAEMDLDRAIWTIPAGRMKAGREHRVPLSDPAVALLERLHEARHGDHVFPGGTAGKSLSNMALLTLLRRMNFSHVTAHGFRSTFKDWTMECTSFPNEVSEMALGHAVGDKVEAAYRRGDLFEKRRELMQAWGQTCRV